MRLPFPLYFIFIDYCWTAINQNKHAGTTAASSVPYISLVFFVIYPRSAPASASLCVSVCVCVRVRVCGVCASWLCPCLYEQKCWCLSVCVLSGENWQRMEHFIMPAGPQSTCEIQWAQPSVPPYASMLVVWARDWLKTPPKQWLCIAVLGIRIFTCRLRC